MDRFPACHCGVETVRRASRPGLGGGRPRGEGSPAGLENRKERGAKPRKPREGHITGRQKSAGIQRDYGSLRFQINYTKIVVYGTQSLSVLQVPAARGERVPVTHAPGVVARRGKQSSAPGCSPQGVCPSFSVRLSRSVDRPAVADRPSSSPPAALHPAAHSHLSGRRRGVSGEANKQAPTSPLCLPRSPAAPGAPPLWATGRHPDHL